MILHPLQLEQLIWHHSWWFLILLWKWTYTNTHRTRRKGTEFFKWVTWRSPQLCFKSCLCTWTGTSAWAVEGSGNVWSRCPGIKVTVWRSYACTVDGQMIRYHAGGLQEASSNFRVVNLSPRGLKLFAGQLVDKPWWAECLLPDTASLSLQSWNGHHPCHSRKPRALQLGKWVTVLSSGVVKP